MSCLTSSLNGQHVTLEPQRPFVPWLMRGLALLGDVCKNATWSRRNSSYCVSLLFVFGKKVGAIAIVNDVARRTRSAHDGCHYASGGVCEVNSEERRVL